MTWLIAVRLTPVKWYACFAVPCPLKHLGGPCYMPRDCSSLVGLYCRRTLLWKCGRAHYIYSMGCSCVLMAVCNYHCIPWSFLTCLLFYWWGFRIQVERRKCNQPITCIHHNCIDFPKIIYANQWYRRSFTHLVRYLRFKNVEQKPMLILSTLKNTVRKSNSTQSSVIIQPKIDLDPSDLICIFSTL